MNGLHQEDAETAVSWFSGEQRVSPKLGWKLLHGVIGKLAELGFSDLSRVSPNSLKEFMTSDFKAMKLPRLHVIEGGVTERHAASYSSLAMGRAAMARRARHLAFCRVAELVAKGQSASNDNDPATTTRWRRFTPIMAAAVRRAAERRAP